MPTQNVTLYARWLEPYLILNINEWDVPAEGDSIEVIITTNQVGWNARFSHTWMSIENSGNRSFIVTAAPNTGLSSRTGTVTVNSGDAPPQVITVTQAGTGPEEPN